MLETPPDPRLPADGDCQPPLADPDCEGELEAHGVLQSVVPKRDCFDTLLSHGFRGGASINHGFRGDRFEAIDLVSRWPFP